MPTKIPTPVATPTAPIVPATPAPVIQTTSIEQKMDQILLHLQRMDSRDRLRMWGGFLKGIIAVIPLIILVWSIWYFALHGEEMMKFIANTAASSAAEYTQSQGQSMVDELMKKYSIPGK